MYNISDRGRVALKNVDEPETIEEKILVVLDGEGPKSIGELAHKTGERSRYVERALVRLQGQLYIEGGTTFGDKVRSLVGR